MIDRLTILALKAERIREESKRANVRAELALLTEAREQAVLDGDEIEALSAELREVNGRFWEIAEEMRACERSGAFGAEFTELARSMCRLNDRRAALKRRINERVRSEIIEEKSFGMGEGAAVPKTG